MVHNGKFDITNTDVQATDVIPVAPESFDFEKYQSYSEGLNIRCRDFLQNRVSILVHRRMRVKDVFLDGCRDMKKSLSLQLGALKESMNFMGDIPNFLEPWYGIGVAASAFGADYIWYENQAPATKPQFQSVKDALAYTTVPISRTNIGRYILDTIEYFLDTTKGKLPISLTDVQSPLNVLFGLIDTNNLIYEIVDNPENVKILLMRIAGLIQEFITEQLNLIGSNLVLPGHGFSSCHAFKGLGMSDDYALMLSPSQYKDIAVSAMCKLSKSFSGPAFHSCGNWEKLAETVRNIPNLKMVDGAFGCYTDPSPNNSENMAVFFKDTNIIFNARIVGIADYVLKHFDNIWADGLKLVVVTYCDSPEEQAYVYSQIKKISEIKRLPKKVIKEVKLSNKAKELYGLKTT